MADHPKTGHVTSHNTPKSNPAPKVPIKVTRAGAAQKKMGRG